MQRLPCCRRGRGRMTQEDPRESEGAAAEARGSVRPAAMAGSWYPREPDRLAAEVDRYLREAGQAPRPGVRALIAPHAGLVYSGPVAAHAYAAVRGGAVRLGRARGAVAPRRLRRRLARRARRVRDPARPGARGHRHRRAPARRVLRNRSELRGPIAASTRSSSSFPSCAECSRTLLSCRWSSASSAGRPSSPSPTRCPPPCPARARCWSRAPDLSHYFDAVRAAALDARFVDCVDRFDADALLAEFERYPEHERGRYVACGGAAAIAVMRAARALGATHGQVLVRSDSAAVSGDLQRVVGYLAAVLD